MYKYQVFIKSIIDNTRQNICAISGNTFRECANKVSNGDVCGMFLEVDVDNIEQIMKRFYNTKDYEILVGEYQDCYNLFVKRI